MSQIAVATGAESPGVRQSTIRETLDGFQATHLLPTRSSHVKQLHLSREASMARGLAATARPDTRIVSGEPLAAQS